MYKREDIEDLKLGDLVTVRNQYEDYTIRLLSTPDPDNNRLNGEVVRVKKTNSTHIVYVGNCYDGFMRSFFKKEKKDIETEFNKTLGELELCLKKEIL